MAGASSTLLALVTGRSSADEVWADTSPDGKKRKLSRRKVPLRFFAASEEKEITVAIIEGLQDIV